MQRHLEQIKTHSTILMQCASDIISHRIPGLNFKDQKSVKKMAY